MKGCTAARVPRSPLSMDPPQPLQRSSNLLTERISPWGEAAAVHWAAIHTALGWGAAAVTAGPTLHLHFHSAYLRVDSSSLKDAVGQCCASLCLEAHLASDATGFGKCTMANMSEAAPDGEYGGGGLPASLQVRTSLAIAAQPLVRFRLRGSKQRSWMQ